MIVRKINTVDDALKERLIELSGLLNDPELDVAATMKYVISQINRLGLFGAFDDNTLMGYILAEPPGDLYPRRAFLWITAVDKHVPRIVSDGMFDMMCRWCIQQGATYLWGWTKRSSKAINRLYGFEEVAEKQVIRPLIGNDHLIVERAIA